MNIKKALVSVVTCVGLLASTVMPAFAATSPDYIDGKDLAWNTVDGKSFWYEGGRKQGTLSDTKCFTYDGSLRGREIYDKASDGWYWLDVIYDGAKAVNKEVFMPYVFQGDSTWNEDGIKKAAAECDPGMADFVADCIRKKTGKWVRYDENGKMFKGWVTIQGELAVTYPDQKGNTYYYDTKTGLMAKGWISMNGMWYYFDETTGAFRGIYSTKIDAKTITKEDDKANRANIYYDKLGTAGMVYAIEADVELSSSSPNCQAMLVIGNGNDTIKFGLGYEKESKITEASGKCAVISSVYTAADKSTKTEDYKQYYQGVTGKAHLLMFVDAKTGTAWLFHNYNFVGFVRNQALSGKDLYIRANAVTPGQGSVSAAFKNVKVKSPVYGEEIVTVNGKPNIVKLDEKNMSFTPFVADSTNGYLHSGVWSSNQTFAAPTTGYGYVEFVNGTKIY